jgi:WD40 repeat protein
MRGHEGPVTTVAVTPDGRHAVSSSVQDCTLRLWRLADGVLLATLQGEGEYWVSALAPDGRTLVTGDRYGRVDVFCLEALDSASGLRTATHGDPP